jgi:hypothetical protein
MLVALLLYAYSQGVYSSRRIARGCEERLDFAAVTALQRPDFRAIGAFRKRHAAALQGLFAQALLLCREVGLKRLGQVALDPAPAKARDRTRRVRSGVEARLAAEIGAWLRAAGSADRAEDRVHGAERRGDEMPAWAASRAGRRARIRDAKAALAAADAAGKGPLRARPNAARGARSRAVTPKGAAGSRAASR